jgi:toxin-antitoxin system PIN domain toxin
MKRCLVDVNVWLGVLWSRHEHHRRARKWYSSVEANGAFFCRQTQLGLLRLLTNGQVMQHDVMSQEIAWQMYDELACDERTSFAPEPAGLEDGFRRLSTGPFSSTKAWNDGYLAAFAITAGLWIVSFDGAITRYEGVRSIAVPAD